MSRWAVAICVTLVAGSFTFGGSVTFTGSDSSGRSASATFSVVGNTLTATLTNTGSVAAAVDPTFVLSAMFFDITGSPALQGISATGNVVTLVPSRPVNAGWANN